MKIVHSALPLHNPFISAEKFMSPFHIRLTEYITNSIRAWILPLQILNKLFLTGVKNSSFFHNEIFLSIVENKLSHCSNVMMSNMSDKIWIGKVLEQISSWAALMVNSTYLSHFSKLIFLCPCCWGRRISLVKYSRNAWSSHTFFVSISLKLVVYIYYIFYKISEEKRNHILLNLSLYLPL